jgi:hypothetical protein
MGSGGASIALHRYVFLTTRPFNLKSLKVVYSFTTNFGSLVGESLSFDKILTDLGVD